MEIRFRRSEWIVGWRSYQNGYDPRRGSFRNAGNQSPGGALRESHWTDYFSGKTFCGGEDRQMGCADRSARPVEAVHGERRYRTGKPTIACRKVRNYWLSCRQAQQPTMKRAFARGGAPQPTEESGANVSARSTYNGQTSPASDLRRLTQKKSPCASECRDWPTDAAGIPWKSPSNSEWRSAFSARHARSHTHAPHFSRTDTFYRRFMGRRTIRFGRGCCPYFDEVIELTSMVSPLSVPVTFTFSPANARGFF